MIFESLNREISDPQLGQPFSFIYHGKQSKRLLPSWDFILNERAVPDGVQTCAEWTDPTTGLRIEWEVTSYQDFPAVDWVVHFSNTGEADTPIIENIQALDMSIRAPGPYLLHKTKGAPSNPTDFEPGIAAIDSIHTGVMGGGGGRSSNKDLPFFKVEVGTSSIIVAVGWSGQWIARLECPDRQELQVTAGMETAHFVLHPGERVRSPRILMFFWDGDTYESNAQFRQLIYKHYAAKWNGKDPLPMLFCNTAFTRGGVWLNECNTENQISLIDAYSPLGIEALITDAGWFPGRWPNGVGTWTPRTDAYPDGMGPVAQAAADNGMVYGLWFEPERVMKGSWIYEYHPEWLLSSANGPDDTYLLNFGLEDVRDYIFGVVEQFMELPGFRFYRQDFNMDPLPYWRDNEQPNRHGMTEIRYIEGLYEFWDRIAWKYPDSIREECASGGRRIDIETVMRMHLHQESDYWFDNEVDQARIWSLSRYLPNNVFDTPLVRLDDYSFHSTLATSLIPGWIADEPGFDVDRAKYVLDVYRSIRHLLVGAWYPLTPYSHETTEWLAMQFHRPDLDQGMVLAFRRQNCQQQSVELALRGLDPNATYELVFHSAGMVVELPGARLLRQLAVTLAGAPASELIIYRRIEA